MPKEFIPSPDKLYYAISEVADILGETPSLLRFWEKTFPELKPRKNKRGQRQYTAEDIKEFLLVHSLVKEQGYTLEGAHDKLKNDRKAVKSKQEIVERLTKVKEFLLEIKSHL